ncbi:sorbosone dehydrogenase [Terrihabitans soli]|uniref:Sorbosone dehydrogenase n=1 Tax=Terrihabitans soli TaxID=708113 RepID=A0A6S6QS85_9HYPH|nr:sorbosone dehydrogenase family protein [Terrihabitans soli]BCJ90142.1 sorbosone dehydrogenase [Terrihabitans soli]
MTTVLWRAGLAAFLCLSLAGCGEEATIPAEQGYGPDPVLPEPNPTLFPTVHIAETEPWPPGTAPKAAPGFKVNRFADGLDHPRWIYVLPNGDVLVAESQAPPKPEEAKGFRDMIMGFFMKSAGSGATPSANRITLLRDADGDGMAEERSTFLENLTSPFGMVLTGDNDKFYVANADTLMRFTYTDGALKIDGAGEKVTDLPSGINHHWTKDVTASPDGSRLYVTVGSNSNVAENGMEAEKDRANVLEVDSATGQYRVFASGLRNPNGLSWQPDSGALWVAVNERDEIGSDLVPDYMTSVKDGAFYGWPYSYYGQHVDERVEPQNPDLVAKAVKPDYALGAHSASLGLTFNTGTLFPEAYRNGAFVGQHGSWNRKPRAGYRVIFVPFTNGMPSGPPQEILGGFLSPGDKAYGRPVGVKNAKDGALLVADDVGNVIWRVTPQ